MSHRILRTHPLYPVPPYPFNSIYPTYGARLAPPSKRLKGGKESKAAKGLKTALKILAGPAGWAYLAAQAREKNKKKAKKIQKEIDNIPIDIYDVPKPAPSSYPKVEIPQTTIPAVPMKIPDTTPTNFDFYDPDMEENTKPKSRVKNMYHH